MHANIRKNGHIVSSFTNIYAKGKQNDIPIEEYLSDIRNGTYKELVELIRKEQSKELRNKQKSKLPAITASCIVSGNRQIKDVLNHSGLMQVDIDDIEVENASRVKSLLANDKYTFSTFFSPSGKVKCIVKVLPDINLHKNQFQSLTNYYKNTYNIMCDESVKDINRLMFYSWDPEIYHNPDSLVFQEYAPLGNQKNGFNYTQSQLDALEVIRRIEENGIDITGSHNDWIKIIYSLIEIFGNNCAEFIHRVSRYYPTYDYFETQEKIEACLKSNGDGVTKDTFFYYAKSNGIDIRGTVTKTKPTVQEKVIQNSAQADETRLNRFILAKRFLSQRYIIRFNEVSFDFEYKHKDSDDQFKVLNENNIYVEIQENGLNISLPNLMAILKSDFVKRYDPITSYFENLASWDGIDHIELLANHVKAKNQKIFNHHFRKWLVRAVACATAPNYFNKQMLVLIGDEQNTGKSTYCRFLCPPSLSNYIAENISIDKDSRIALAKNFLINQDELETMTKGDINGLKSLMSKDKVNDRLPYDRKNSILPRRCSFIASTNQFEFLSDETGSVRWLCFEISGIDWNYSKCINIDKVYAQAYHLLMSGNFEYEMTPQEIKENNRRNRSYFIPTFEQVLVEKYFKPCKEKDDRNFYQPTQVVRKLIELTDSKVKVTPVGIEKALKHLGFVREKHPRYQVYGYYIKINN
ncbi:MAG: VapE domain-containing protein [bacterium]